MPCWRRARGSARIDRRLPGGRVSSEHRVDDVLEVGDSLPVKLSDANGAALPRLVNVDPDISSTVVLFDDSFDVSVGELAFELVTLTRAGVPHARLAVRRDHRRDSLRYILQSFKTALGCHLVLPFFLFRIVVAVVVGNFRFSPVITPIHPTTVPGRSFVITFVKTRRGCVALRLRTPVHRGRAFAIL